jgi:RHS repeat-associated protein
MSGLNDACCQQSRVRRSHGQPNFCWPGTRTKYVYDRAGHLLGEYTGTGGLIQETVWLGDTPVATLRPNGSSVAIYYVETDQINAPRAVLAPSNNAVRWTWYVRPFGNYAPVTSPQGLANFTYDLRFPGQIAGAWGNTFQNDNRDYDPYVGGYVESDPIGLAGGSYSTYAYASGDPITNYDSLGLLDNPAEIMNLYFPNTYHVVTGIPPDSVWYKAPDGECFPAPPGLNWNNMYDVGMFAGPLSPLLVGQGSWYDLQRSDGNVYPAYQYAANYAVGVVTNGGGYPLWLLNYIGQEYGNAYSQNSSHNTWPQWWANGWNAANTHNLPQKPSKCSCGGG